MSLVLPVHARHPPLCVVRKFAHLLNQSQEDFSAEAELLKLQEDVVRKIRSNQQLEQDLNLMDIKIGLLVKNRITLQVSCPDCPSPSPAALHPRSAGGMWTACSAGAVGGQSDTLGGRLPFSSLEGVSLFPSRMQRQIRKLL